MRRRVASETPDRPNSREVPNRRLDGPLLGRHGGRAHVCASLPGEMTERNANTRRRISDAGHAPNSTYSHWLTPTNAVSSKNHGETSAASAADSRVTLPASAN